MLRNPRRIRQVAATAAAAVALTLPLAGSVGAQSFLDPANPCPRGVASPPAPFADRGNTPEAHRLNVDCAFALQVTLGAGGNPNRYLGGFAVPRDQMASYVARALRASGYALPAPADQGFRDIAGNVHRDNINVLAQIGVTMGTSAGQFSPRTLVTRDQMASFLIRAAEFAYGEPAGGLAAGTEPIAALTFSDVPEGNVHRGNIIAAADLLGLTQGVQPGRYVPAGNVTRDQMATFVVRLVDVVYNL